MLDWQMDQLTDITILRLLALLKPVSMCPKSSLYIFTIFSLVELFWKGSLVICALGMHAKITGPSSKSDGSDVSCVASTWAEGKYNECGIGMHGTKYCICPAESPCTLNSCKNWDKKLGLGDNDVVTCYRCDIVRVTIAASQHINTLRFFINNG